MTAVGERNDLGLTAWDRYRILTTYRTIAMVGLSTNYYNASSFAAIYLDANGYDIIPVNPVQAGKTEILGKPGASCVEYSQSPSHGHARMRMVCFANGKVEVLFRRWM